MWLLEDTSDSLCNCGCPRILGESRILVARAITSVRVHTRVVIYDAWNRQCSLDCCMFVITPEN